MTRDAHRIGSVLDVIRRYWESHPDQRLGQILINAAFFAAPGVDPFYVEDDALAGGVAQLLLLDPGRNFSSDD